MSYSRREFLRRVAAASFLLATGAVALWELVEYVPGGGGQAGTILLPPSNSTQGTQTAGQAAPNGYVFVAPVSALTGKTSAYFNHPAFGQSLLLSLGGQWKAFSATCTHAPCTVQYSGSQIQCPCHGGVFDPANGSVVSGPPPTRLPEFGVLIQNGNLYVTTQVVN